MDNSSQKPHAAHYIICIFHTAIMNITFAKVEGKKDGIKAVLKKIQMLNY